MQNLKKIKQKLNIGVLLLLLLMSIAVFFVGEKPKNTATENKTIKNHKKIDYLSKIPQRPLLLKDTDSYKNANLKGKVGQLKEKSQLQIKSLDQKNHAFKLSDNTYISAKADLVGADEILSMQDKKTVIYSSTDTPVYYTPYTSYDKEIYTTVKGTQRFKTNRMATSHWGTYYEVSFNGGQTGWIDSKKLIDHNPKLNQVQFMLKQKYSNEKYSITVKEVDNGYSVGINQDLKMYSASLSKIPILYWTQKQLSEEKSTLSDQLFYSGNVTNFPGAYDPEGTGNMPKEADNKDYSLLDVINQTAKESDNVGSNLLAYYETNKFSADYQTEITKIAGEKWDPTEREASSRMVGKVLEALYEEGGAPFNALFNTAFDDSRLKAGVPANIKVAHKIGAADEFNHDAAIVFTDQPYLIVVETDGGSDQLLTDISKDVYEVLK